MLELIASALITILPDYLYRRYREGKRLGQEITLYNFWYELRWGVTACGVLAITLLTVIFFYHPTTSNVVLAFRTVSIISDRPGRVEKVYVRNNQALQAGDPIFRLDTSRQRAAAETARRRISEVDAETVQAKAELTVAEGNIAVAQGDLRKAQDTLERREKVFERNPANVSEAEMERLRATVQSRNGALDAARAHREVIQVRISSVLPAQRSSAQAALAQAENEIAKATVFAGVDGAVKQFVLRPGDIVSPILRPAGILVPTSSGRGRFQASFQQISAQVLQVGMIAEVACWSKPLTVIPLVVTEIQGAIPAGQIRPTDQLIDLQERIRPGTLLVFLEPIYGDDRTDGIPPGSSCFGVTYSSHAAEIEAGKITSVNALVMRLVDGMGIANAIVIRAQALLLPIRAIIFSG
jgi:multidrug resistance efflux pump